MIVISHFQASKIMQCHQGYQEKILVSPDLGLSQVWATIQPECVVFPTGESLSWSDIRLVADDQSGCYLVSGDQLKQVKSFSESSGRVYTLYPTAGAPTMLVSGIPMHRIKGIDPHQDTIRKIKATGFLGGIVLDTTTGLGYTAIEAAKTAKDVYTIEIDQAAQEIASANPWSLSLFVSENIHQIIGDSYEITDNFESGYFSCIIHDPPTFSLAGELYSTEFYRKAYRVLKTKGRMFHYVGDPASKSGARLTRGVIRRLKDAGFTNVLPKPEAFGILAYK